MMELISVTPVDTGKTSKDYNEAFFNKLHEEMRRLYSEAVESKNYSYRRAFNASMPTIVNDTFYLVTNGESIHEKEKGNDFIVTDAGITLCLRTDICYGIDVSIDRFMPKSSTKKGNPTAIKQTFKFCDLANNNPVLDFKKSGPVWVFTKKPLSKDSPKYIEDEEFGEIYTSMADCVLKLMNILYEA